MYHSLIIMVIVVKYFASISDAIGKASEKINIQPGVTADDVWSEAFPIASLILAKYFTTITIIISE